MKKTLMVLLCLLVTACKELEKVTGNEPEPCPLAAFMPQHYISIANFPKGSHYEIIVNNQLLWNSCSQTSKFGSLSATINTNSNKFSVRFQLYENIFQENTNAEVKIYKTDANCDIDPGSEVIRTGTPQITKHTYNNPPHCGETIQTSSHLYIDYEPPYFCGTDE